MSENTQQARTSKPQQAEDALTRGVIAGIRGLIDGNGAQAADLKVDSTERFERSVRMRLSVRISWNYQKGVELGQVHPAGSQFCRDASMTQAGMQIQCGEAAQSQEIANELSSWLGHDPIARLKDLKDGFIIKPLPYRYHHPESCGSCSGSGKQDCSFCSRGKIRCSCGDGRSTCYGCGGAGSFYSNSGQTRCGACGGSGRSGSCTTCSGSGYYSCLTCFGSGKVTCSTCSGNGWFTHTYNTSLTGHVERTWLFDKALPETVKDGLRAIGVRELPGKHAATSLSGLHAEPGKVSADFTASFPHVHARMTVREVGIEIDALGNQGYVPLMPTFLDELLADIAEVLRSKACSPDKAFSQAGNSRVTQGLLQAAASKDKFDPAVFSATYGRAVSTGLVKTLYDALNTSYDGLGRSSIRAGWLIGGTLTIAAVALERLYDANLVVRSALFDAGYYFVDAPAWEYITALAIAALPFLATVYGAGNWGRHTVRKVLGQIAIRRPSQGLLPFTAALLAVCVHIGLSYLPADAGTFGLPGRDQAQPGNARSMSELGGWAIEAMPATAAATLIAGAAYLGLTLPKSTVERQKTPTQTNSSGKSGPIKQKQKKQAAKNVQTK